MDIQFGNPNSIYLLGLVIVGVALMIWTLAVRRRAARRFASSRFRDQLMPRRASVRRGLSAVLVTASLVLMVFALLDIRWGKTTREVPQKGIEVVFALDVSRSMLAEDATPNRLSRAKQQIKDMVDEMAGDRVGLVVFAGETKQSVPLTSHYDDFKQVLDSVGPHSLRVGGSRLGEAIQAAADGFISKTNDHKAIVLFTDGEDQESNPLRIASKLHEEQGIRIFTVGLGDMDQGTRIPDDQSRRGAFLEHKGQQVWSKLNGQLLKEIATETNGAFIPAGTKRVNMADVYHGYVANVPQTEFESAKINAWIPRFQWFAGAALLLLLLEIWISTRKSKARVHQATASSVRDGAESADDFAATSTNRRRTSRSKVAAAVLTLVLLPALPAQAQVTTDVAKEMNAANELLRKQKTTEAINALSAIDPRAADRDTLNYNLAVAHYRNGDFESASTLFRQAATATDDAIAADSRYNLGNCHYANALPLVEQDRAGAIEQLKSAINNYRSSLRLNRDNADARANIELANRLIEQLQEQEEQDNQEQQQQQEPNQNDQQQNQDQQQDQQSQKEQSEDNLSTSDQRQQDDQQQQDEQQQQSESDPSQSDTSKQNEESTGNQEPQNESQQDPGQQAPQSGDAQRQSPDQPQQNQQDLNEAEAAGEDKQDEETKETPTGQLTDANEADEQEGKAQQAAVIPSDEQEGLMSKEEALKMLQSVRDRDMLRRLRQQQRERSRRRPVDRDW